MKKMVKLSVVAALAVTSSAFAASDLAGAFKEGTTSGYVRAMYIGQDNKGTTTDVTSLGVGGKLGYVTGSLNGFQAGASFFTTNAINQANDLDKSEAYMFGADKKGYNILGEAYLQYNIGKTIVKVGRQQLDTPLAGSDDVRLIPNMFEAYTVINQDVADTTLVASHVTKMAGLDGRSSYTNFKSMSEQAYTSLTLSGLTPTAGGDTFDVSSSSGKKGVSAVGIVYAGIKDLTLQAWNYYGHDVLNALYADATYTPKLTSDLTLTLAGQGYKIAEIGKLKTTEDSLGLNTSYAVYGAKAAIASEATGLTGTLAYNKVTGNDNTVTVFGAWGGYPEYAIGEEFWMNSVASTNGKGSMAKSSVTRAAVDLNLGAFGLGDRVFTVAQSKFNLNEAIIANNDVDVTDFIYTCKPVKNLTVRAVYEKRDSKDDTQDNNRIKVSANYSF